MEISTSFRNRHQQHELKETMGSRTLSVLIVEDEVGVQQRLSACLQNVKEIGEFELACDLAQARAALKRFQPDLVLLDIGLPDGSGLELLLHPTIRKSHVKPLILTAFGDESTIVKAIELGAQGYLLKEEPDEEIVRGLCNILKGTPPLSASVAQCILHHMRQQSAAGQKDDNAIILPPRQKQTLSLLARGMTYREIAQDMDITFHTVSAYAQEIYNKFAVKSRSEAVYKALEMGIIELTKTH